jgi:spoIIIJ-associated protein
MSESNQNPGDPEVARDEDDGEGEVGDESSERSAQGQRRRRAGPRSGGEAEADSFEADERSREALAFTSDVIVKMGMDCDVRLKRPEEESTDIQIHVTGPDAGRIIGKKGQVLAAVQFIVNRAMNRPGLERRYVSVDADGYRSRREDSLASMARRLGKQAVSDGQIITFEPMSPRDRRVVHLALAKFEGVVTKSEGEGDDRRVQIIPVRRG